MNLSMRAIFLTLFFGLATLSRADVLSIALTPDTLSGSPGDELDFIATLTNNTGETVFLNGDSFTFALTDLDDSPFFANAPLSLDPHEISTPFELFDVVIPAGTPSGSYAGTFTILGGANGNAGDNLGTEGFSVIVTPEPSTLFTLLGLTAALLLLRGARPHAGAMDGHE
jgi:hypothetical protein